LSSSIRANTAFYRTAYFEDLAWIFDQWGRDSPLKHLMTETDSHSKMYLGKPVMDNNTEILVTSKLRQDQLDATNNDLLAINYSSTCFGCLYTHQENRLRVTAVATQLSGTSTATARTENHRQ
jgi:hypothetical protein